MLAGGAAAQTSDEENDPGTLGDSRLLETITVTATRNPIEAFQYPGMVTVIGRERIETLQPSTPDDVLRFVPGVEFTGGPRRTGEVPSIRGLDGEDVIVLFDGARQNFNSGHDGRFFIDPSLLRQVEVLRGPSSALYGSGGLGGVIEFRTVSASDFLTPGETVGAFVSTGYQTVNREVAGTVTGYGRPVDGLDLLVSLTGRSSGSITLSDGTELTPTDDDILSGLAKATYDFADFHSVDASFLRFQNDVTEPNNGQGLNTDNLADKDIVSDTYRIAYSYSNPADTLFDLDAIAYYTDIQADEERLVASSLGPAGEELRRDLDTIGFRLDNRSRLRLNDSLMTTFTYGGEAYRDEQEGAAGSAERAGVPDAEAEFYGIFAQAEIAITEPLGIVPGDVLVIPGIRYDDFESSSDIAADNSDNEISPRIGVSYLPTEWLMVFGNYSEAFRAPSFDELFQEGTHFFVGPFPNVFVPNPDLRPQRTRTWEFGGGFSFNDVLAPRDRFEIKGSYYETDGEDFIDTEVIVNPPVQNETLTFNVPNAKLRGAEIEAFYESDRFLLSLGFSRIDGENEDTGEKLGVLAPNQYTADFAVKLPEYDSLVGWRLLAAEEFDKVDAGDPTVPGYGVNDIYYAWAPSDGPLQGLRLDLGVDNVFDQEYRRVTGGAGVVEEGRNYKALISYRIQW